MKRKFWNWVRNEGEPSVLVLNGEISDETWFGDEVTPGLFRDELQQCQGDISVWINSPGAGYSVNLGSAGANSLTLSSGRLSLTGNDDFTLTRSGSSSAVSNTNTHHTWRAIASAWCSAAWSSARKSRRNQHRARASEGSGLRRFTAGSVADH